MLFAVAAMALTASCGDDGATGGPADDGSVASTTTTSTSGTAASTTAIPTTGAPGDDGSAGGDTNAGFATNVNASLLDIAAPLVGGGSLDLSTLGDRPVLLWFWAPF